MQNTNANANANTMLRKLLSCQAILTFVGVVSAVQAVGLVLSRYQWARLFTDEDDIIALVADTLPLVAIQVRAALCV